MKKKSGVAKLREKINRIDQELLELLADRRKVVANIVRAKDELAGRIRDTGREEEILASLIQKGRELGLDAHFVTRVFHEIIDDSLQLQQEYLQRVANEETESGMVRVAFQGIEGAYSHLAAQEFFAGQEEQLLPLGLPTFGEVIQAVEDGQAEFAMLPIENTTSGSITEVYDLLLHTRLSIVGEIRFKVEHCLVGTEDVPLAKLKTVYSHPQAVAQCTRFLRSLAQCRIETHYDTAGSVQKIHDEGDPTQAAIASEAAADRFGLKILKRQIANQEGNYTRFLIAGRQPRRVDERIPSKTSLVMATGQQAGSLVEALLVFREHELALTKLESRPILGNPWEEMFYVDFEGNVVDERVEAALRDLRKVTRFLRVLGTYPSRDLPRTAPPKPAVATRTGKKSTETIDRPAPRPRTQTTMVKIGDVVLGGPEIVVIAGPVVLESREQILEHARQVKESGAHILRGDCFKSHSSSQGPELGEAGLDLLTEAGRAYGLPVVTEVTAPEQLSEVAQRADAMLVGARNMQNQALLQAVGRVHCPIILERGPMASLEDWLQAAGQILDEGNQQVVLCERGVRTFEMHRPSALDLTSVPILKSRTHLPILVDPSRSGGSPDHVPVVAKAAQVIGAHGLLLQIAPDPGDEFSLSFDDFGELMESLFVS